MFCHYRIGLEGFQSCLTRAFDPLVNIEINCTIIICLKNCICNIRSQSCDNYPKSYKKEAVIY